VFIAAFPGPGRTFQVSPAGGDSPRWRGDGQELLYIADNQIMSAGIGSNGQSIEIGRVHPLFGGLVSTVVNRYDVSHDGERILLAKPVPPHDGDPLTLVQNWTATVKK
jgi:hypothetical protein